MAARFFRLLICITIFSPILHAYTGKNSSEATMSFSHWVELPAESHSRATALETIYFQVSHLFGPMSLGKFIGAPKLNEIIDPITLTIEKRDDGVYIARYDYVGTIVMRKNTGNKVQIPLPNNPAQIWQTTMNNKTTKLNPCTDATYQGKGDFWYFWDLEREGCKQIIKKDIDYSFITAHLQPIANTETTYPEYENLPTKTGLIEVTLIMGKDESSRIRSPFSPQGRRDLNAKNFRKLDQSILKLGFTGREMSNAEIKAIVKQQLNPYPFVKEYNFEYDGERASEMRIRLVYTNTEIDHKSTGFHYFFENALEKSAFFIYDGHSGLGENLDFNNIRESVKNKFRINLNKTKYQIYFFNSCTSYAYYNDDFFAKKVIDGASDSKGSQYLDILTTGLETGFENSAKINMSLIEAVHNWAISGDKESYQELANKMEDDNLFGINGDEDNPTQP